MKNIKIILTGGATVLLTIFSKNPVHHFLSEKRFKIMTTGLLIIASIYHLVLVRFLDFLKR